MVCAAVDLHITSLCAPRMKCPFDPCRSTSILIPGHGLMRRFIPAPGMEAKRRHRAVLRGVLLFCSAVIGALFPVCRPWPCTVVHPPLLFGVSVSSARLSPVLACAVT